MWGRYTVYGKHARIHTACFECNTCFTHTSPRLQQHRTVSCIAGDEREVPPRDVKTAHDALQTEIKTRPPPVCPLRLHAFKSSLANRER